MLDDVAEVKWLSEPDSGVYEAFNKGLRLAQGDLIAFLNAGDTYCHPSVVSRVVAALGESALDAVFGDVVIVDPRDESRVRAPLFLTRVQARAAGVGLHAGAPHAVPPASRL